MLDPRFQTCIHAARSGSLTRAAEELYLSKQAVKKQIDSLEAELGFRLFLRGSRGLTLTEAGRQFVEGVEQLTAQYHRLADRCRLAGDRPEQPTLTILLPSHPKVYFEQAMLTYNRLYPQVRLEIADTRKLSVLYDYRARINTLLEGTADIVFAPRTERYDEERLAFCSLNHLSYRCLMKPDHPLSTRETVRREDLAGWPVRINTVMDRQLYDHILDQEPTALPGSFVYGERESFRVPLIISFCLNGGVFLSRGDFLETLHPLIALPFEPAMSVENGLFYRRDAAPHVMDFIDLVRREVSGSLPPEV
jgi:DNA-binding transcriptional LysR family regulator